MDKYSKHFLLNVDTAKEYAVEKVGYFKEDEKLEAGLSTLFQTNFFRLFFRYCTGV